jgi:hypothetical protein
MLLDNADGSGEMLDVRFKDCDRQSLLAIETLDLGPDELDQWRAAHGGGFDATEMLLARMAPVG